MKPFPCDTIDRPSEVDLHRGLGPAQLVDPEEDGTVQDVAHTLPAKPEGGLLLKPQRLVPVSGKELVDPRRVLHVLQGISTPGRGLTQQQGGEASRDHAARAHRSSGFTAGSATSNRNLV